ncbi:MAG: glycoside hydrolase family 43 protein [Bacteroidota bacterium]|nr:glycoside hydrolase family 43 protein [Bacteroidota bacterium]
MKTRHQSIRFAAAALFVIFLGCGKSGSRKVTPPPVKPAVSYFTNPLISSGPDPWVAQKDGNYYFTKTSGDKLQVYATTKMSKLGQVTPQTVWQPPATGGYSHDIWAPEIHYIQNKWYMYFAADDGNDINHRMYVLGTDDASPATTNWTLKGKLTPLTDKWAIDGTILQYNGQLYMIWSGWQGDNQPGMQQLYIAKMKDPYTIDGDRVMISQPDHAWEKNGSAVNEGPEIMTNSAGNVFLIYSASSCFTDDYCLGMLSLKSNGNPLAPGDWTKAPNPVFTKNTAGSTFGPGHCGFFKSPDGTEDWIIYHANSLSGAGCGDQRNPRMQKFTWNTDGTPNFASPVPAGMNIKVPSGE